MSCIIVAGSADNETTALCEFIADKIKLVNSNVDFRIVIKHPKDWPSHIAEVCFN